MIIIINIIIVTNHYHHHYDYYELAIMIIIIIIIRIGNDLNFNIIMNYCYIIISNYQSSMINYQL